MAPWAAQRGSAADADRVASSSECAMPADLCYTASLFACALPSLAAADRFPLEAPADGFQPGRVEVFGLPGLANVGSLKQLELGVANTMCPGWFVSTVKVINETLGETALFVINAHLMPNQPALFDVFVPEPCDYVVEVQTGNVFGAGEAGARRQWVHAIKMERSLLAATV